MCRRCGPVAPAAVAVPIPAPISVPISVMVEKCAHGNIAVRHYEGGFRTELVNGFTEAIAPSVEVIVAMRPCVDGYACAGRKIACAGCAEAAAFDCDGAAGG